LKKQSQLNVGDITRASQPITLQVQQVSVDATSSKCMPPPL